MYYEEDSGALDLTTRLATARGFLDSLVRGRAFDSTGTLFGALCDVNAALVTIDPPTAAFLEDVGPITPPVTTCGGKLVFFAAE